MIGGAMSINSVWLGCNEKQDWNGFLSHKLRNEWKILQIDNNFLSLNYHTSFTQQDDKIIFFHVKMTTKLPGKEAALNTKLSATLKK